MNIIFPAVLSSVGLLLLAQPYLRPLLAFLSRVLIANGNTAAPAAMPTLNLGLDPESQAQATEEPAERRISKQEAFLAIELVTKYFEQSGPAQGLTAAREAGRALFTADRSSAAKKS